MQIPTNFSGHDDSFCATLESIPMEAEPTDNDVTLLLAAWRDGDTAAEARLLEIVYQELRQIARYNMRREAADHTLQPTALVSEAYLRLFGSKVDWQNRAQFFGVAARTMRRILVDHARGRNTQKRDGGRRVDLDEAFLVAPDQVEDVLALDTALEKLARNDARQAKLVELRFFAGMTLEEAADSLGISVRTARRDWNFARAWLYREISSHRAESQED